MPDLLNLPFLAPRRPAPEAVVITMPFVGGFCGAMPGAGRTTLLLEVTRTLLRVPQHVRLVVVESGAVPGVVRERLGLPEGPTLEDVVRGAPGRDHAVQATPFGFSLVAAPSGHAIRPPVSAEDVEWVARRLRVHFEVVLFDQGPDPARMPDAHLLRRVCERLVVVVPATLEGAEGAAHTLSYLEEARGPRWLRRRVVVVLNRVDEASRLEARVVAGWLGPRVAEVVSMPYEPGLAAAGAEPKLTGAGARAVAAIAQALRRSPDEEGPI